MESSLGKGRLASLDILMFSIFRTIYLSFSLIYKMARMLIGQMNQFMIFSIGYLLIAYIDYFDAYRESSIYKGKFRRYL